MRATGSSSILKSERPTAGTSASSIGHGVYQCLGVHPRAAVRGRELQRHVRHPREVQVKEEYLDRDLPSLVVSQTKDGTPFPRMCGFLLTLERHDVIVTIMGQAKRATVYLEPTLHRALRVKAAETDLSVSELVNNAVRAGLAEDAEDLEAIRARAKEPTSSFETLVSDLKRRGKL